MPLATLHRPSEEPAIQTGNAESTPPAVVPQADDAGWHPSDDIGASGPHRLISPPRRDVDGTVWERAFPQSNDQRIRQRRRNPDVLGLSRRTQQPQRSDASAIAAMTWGSRMGARGPAPKRSVPAQAAQLLESSVLRKPSGCCHHQTPASAEATGACSAGEPSPRGTHQPDRQRTSSAHRVLGSPR